MENTNVHKTHPAILVAATAVTVASLAALGAIFGLIPFGKPPTMPEPAAAVAAPTAATPAPAVATPPPAVAAAAAAQPSPPAARTEAPVPRPLKQAAARPAPRPGEAERRTVGDEAPMPARAEARPAASCRDCGVIASVREVTKDGDPSGIGAVAGGVLGGVVGNQMGKGRGRDAMTVIGAVGGAVAGHQIEKSQRTTREFEITVRFDDGTTQIITQSTEPVWRSGDRVRVSGGRIVAL